MTSILFSNLMQDTLKELSKEDYVARSLLGYIYEMNSLKKVVEDASKGKVSSENLLSEYKKISESIKSISNLFKAEIKDYPTKLKNENDFDKLTMVYINENFMKLCPNKMLIPYYTKLHWILKVYIKEYDIEILGAIALRSVKIVNDLYKEGNLEAIDRFLEMLREARKHNGNIIYIVYYGLVCKEHSCEERNISFEKDKEPDVINSILNNNSKLPDSIIKHLCSDRQFEKCLPRPLIVIMITIFMYTGEVGYEGYSSYIGKFLNNDLDNMNEEAKFYDLREIYKTYEDFLNKKVDSFAIEKLLSDIVCDAIMLDDVDDMEDSYGNI